MIFALVALWRGNLGLQAAGVFLLSSQAALFGPSKYGLLPELLPEKDLSWGNGVVELGTFIASISATVASGFLAFYFRGQQHWSGIILLGCTILGLAASFGISRVPAANPARKFNNPFGDLREQIHTIRSDRVLSWAVVGNFYLWFLAALLQFTIVIYGHDVLRIDERHISYLQASVAIGIGLGSLVTGYLSDAKIEYGLIPVGAVGMTVFGFLSATHGISLERASVYLGMLGFFGGFYAVPLNALIQHRPDPARKGGVIAAANLISWVGVFAAAAVYFGLAQGLLLRADEIFLAGACMTLAATFYAVVFLPDSVLRLALWLLTHSIYRIRVEGRDNIPERGGALFVLTELTLVDAIFLAAATDRPIRFVADAKPFARTARLIRTALRITHLPENDTTNGFLNAISASFAANEALCLAGDAASLVLEDSTGRHQLEQFLRETRTAVVAVSVKGGEGGPLQSEEGRLLLASGRHLRSRITVRFLAPLEPAQSLHLAEALSLRKATPATRFS
jgi:acyl-[acyl-carrier-protein]-phospholipid O-acyltransferase/long-chain-fatty-acid--[acyl-carrier-protein] ligase